MLAVVSSTEAACSLDDCESDWAVAETWPEALLRLSAAVRTSPMISPSLPRGLVGSLVRLLTGLLHQLGLEVGQFVDRRHVVELRLAHFAQQVRGGLFGLAAPGDVDELVEVGDEFLAQVERVGNQFLAGIRGDRLFELCEAFADNLPRLVDALEFLFYLVRVLHQQDVACRARDDVHVFDDVIGPDRLRKLVLDHVVHLLVEHLYAAVGEYRQYGQQQENDAETEAEAHADFQVLEHDVLSPVMLR
jgi:hypothetical protein